MIPPKKINKWFKTTVSLALIGAMIFAQPQPVQAARSVGEIQKDQQNIDSDSSCLFLQILFLLL